ncbi:hypothetical protein C7459_11527 [Tumebacillus permanentifrigoris]|uniref:Uncharacterized protein n=1 Tax=Tumebacillus permanentifrigoris TaxID=378543 RepID=A0A316DS61_9BACL|nr:hypothetical protein C7459_11527 [Tumebacillus permanentifrigoris]
MLCGYKFQGVEKQIASRRQLISYQEDGWYGNVTQNLTFVQAAGARPSDRIL